MFTTNGAVNNPMLKQPLLENASTGVPLPTPLAPTPHLPRVASAGSYMPPPRHSHQTAVMREAGFADSGYVQRVEEGGADKQMLTAKCEAYFSLDTALAEIQPERSLSFVVKGSSEGVDVQHLKALAKNMGVDVDVQPGPHIKGFVEALTALQSRGIECSGLHIYQNIEGDQLIQSNSRGEQSFNAHQGGDARHYPQANTIYLHSALGTDTQLGSMSGCKTPALILLREIAHCLHFKADPEGYRALTRMKPTLDHVKAFAEVSPYATQNPANFCAEVAAQSMLEGDCIAQGKGPDVEIVYSALGVKLFPEMYGLS